MYAFLSAMLPPFSSLLPPYSNCFVCAAFTFIIFFFSILRLYISILTDHPRTYCHNFPSVPVWVKYLIHSKKPLGSIRVCGSFCLPQTALGFRQQGAHDGWPPGADAAPSLVGHTCTHRAGCCLAWQEDSWAHLALCLSLQDGSRSGSSSYSTESLGASSLTCPWPVIFRFLMPPSSILKQPLPPGTSV